MPDLHQPPPNFTLPDLEGAAHTLTDYRGKIVIVNFWSAECPWVERTDPKLLPLVETWGDEVALLSIASNANETPEQLAEVAAERGLPRVLHDADRKVAKAYDAQTTPELFVLDEQGRLRYQGAFDDTRFRQPDPENHYLRDAVEALRQNEAPDPAETLPYGCSLVYHQ